MVVELSNLFLPIQTLFPKEKVYGVAIVALLSSLL